MILFFKLKMVLWLSWQTFAFRNMLVNAEVVMETGTNLSSFALKLIKILCFQTMFMNPACSYMSVFNNIHVHMLIYCVPLLFHVLSRRVFSFLISYHE